MSDQSNELHKSTLLDELRARAALVQQASSLADTFDEAGDEGRDVQVPEPPGVSDGDWLATVTVCLHDHYGGDLERALRMVNHNRKPCLSARGMGLQPWEVAAFIAQKTM